MPVGIGMIGAGEISDYHLAALEVNAGAQVRVVCGRSSDRAAEQARRYGVADATHRWEDVLARSDVDAVVIATPDHTHHELVMAAIAQGKAVLVQKPIAMTADQAEEMVREAERRRVVLCVAFMHRFFDETVALRAALQGDLLGDVHMVRIRNATAGGGWGRWFYERPPLGVGGVVMQLGVHGIDLLIDLFGNVEAVSGCTGRVLSERALPDGTVVRPEVDDYALAHYRVDRFVASHEMSYTEVAGCDRFRMEVYGSRGTAWLRHPTDGLALFIDTDARGRGWFRPEPAGISPGERQHDAFLDQVLGRAAVDSSAGAAVQGLRVVDALYASATDGRWVSVVGERAATDR